MNLCSDNVDDEDDEDEDGEGDEVDANDDRDGSNDDDNGYDIPESDADSDAPVVNDEEEAAELADMADFVQEAFGGGSGQLRQVVVQPGLISFAFPPCLFIVINKLLLTLIHHLLLDLLIFSRNIQEPRYVMRS